MPLIVWLAFELCQSNLFIFLPSTNFSAPTRLFLGNKAFIGSLKNHLSVDAIADRDGQGHLLGVTASLVPFPKTSRLSPKSPQ